MNHTTNNKINDKDDNNVNRTRIDNNLVKVLESLSIYDVYVVGGYVRDLLLGISSYDIDILVIEDDKTTAKGIAIEIADNFGGSFIVLDEIHKVYRVVIKQDGLSIDIAAPKGKTLIDDLKKRDFTVNTLAIKIDDFLDLLAKHNNDNIISIIIDVNDGIKDIRNRQLNVVYQNAFYDDPLRVLRGVRLAITHNFIIPNATLELMLKYKQLISKISYERIREEIWSMLKCNNSTIAIKFLNEQLGLLPDLLLGFNLQSNLTDKKAIPNIAELHIDLLATNIDFLHIFENLLTETTNFGNSSMEILNYDELQVNNNDKDYLKEHEKRYEERYQHNYLTRYLMEELNVGKKRYTLIKFAILVLNWPMNIAKPIPKRWKLSKDEAKLMLKLVSSSDRNFDRFLLESGRANQAYEMFKTHGMHELYETHEMYKMCRMHEMYYIYEEFGIDAVSVMLLNTVRKIAINSNLYKTTNGTTNKATNETIIGRKENIDFIQQLYDETTMYFEFCNYIDNLQPFLTGEEIIKELNIMPGSQVGLLIKQLRKAQIIGRVKNKTEAIEYLQHIPKPK